MSNVSKALAALLFTACAPLSSDTSESSTPDNNGDGIIASTCRRVDLVSDQEGVAPNVDPHLVNSWGIERGDNAFVIAVEHEGPVAIFDGNGNPSTEGRVRNGALVLGDGITGVARTHSKLFVMNVPDPTCPDATVKLSADYIFANEDGKLIAVSTAVEGGASEVFWEQEGAGYMGVAVLRDPIAGADLILAADFQNNKIIAFDTKLQPVRLPCTTSFEVPGIDEDFAPFNIAVLDGRIFVAYAEQEPGVNDEGEPIFEEAHGPGLGLIAEFDANGQFVRVVAKGGDLNAPWGMSFAQSGFCSIGDPAHEGNKFLLVGNFGDGMLIPIELGQIFDASGREIGSRALPPLVDSSGATIAIDGLWGIIFGDDTVGRSNNLYFAAGPDDEEHGLYGRIETVRAP